MQIAISAGHEFIVTTDAKHAEICDDKIMYLDYVSVPSFGSKDSHGADVLAPFFFLFARFWSRWVPGYDYR